MSDQSDYYNAQEAERKIHDSKTFQCLGLIVVALVLAWAAGCGAIALVEWASK